ncbi:MAG: cation:proton antiporter [Candidatus Woesearchaeota archaeon]
MDTLLLSLIGFSLVIIIGFLAEYFFDKTHIPDVLLLFLLGILLGPILGFINPSSFSAIEPIFITLALILIIFEGSLTIKLDDFLKTAYPGTKLAFLFFFGNIFVVALVMIFFGYPWHLSILLGAILGGTSSAVVIPMTKLLKLNNESTLILTLESTITDVLCIVGAIAITEIIKINQFDFVNTIVGILSTFFIAIMIGFLSGWLWIIIRQKFQQINKAYMIGIAYMIIIYVFAEFFKSNGAIAILSYGMFLGNFKKIFTFFGKEPDYSLHESEKTFYAEISFFLKVFFFVYLGIIISFSNIILLLIGLLITILIAISRPYIVKMSVPKNIEKRDLVFMNILTPKGLAPAVLAQLTLKSEFFTQFKETNDLIIITLSVILFSIILTSILVFIYDYYILKKEGIIKETKNDLKSEDKKEKNTHNHKK